MRSLSPASRAFTLLATGLCVVAAGAAPASAADPPPTPYPGVPDLTPVAPGVQGGVVPAAPAPAAVPTPVPTPASGGVAPSAPGVQGGVVPAAPAPAAQPAPVAPAPGAPAAPGGVSPVAPGVQAGVAQPRAVGDVDVTTDNGGGSPSCRNGVTCEGTANSTAHAEPVDAYGLDYNDDVGFDVGDIVGVAVQSIGAFLWWITLHAFDAVLLVLDWAFNLDIVLDSLTSIQQSLGDMQAALGGDDWLLLGIAVAGLWGTWNGLVRQRTLETMSGLAVTVALIVLAMAIVKNPDGTVGEVSRWSNESSLAALSAVSSGGVDDGLQNFAEANTRLWNVVVGEPWCVLQFGSIENCQRDWLQHASNSQERVDLATAARASDPQLVALQEPSGAISRFGVLALVIPGIVGAICLLVYIGGRLVLASIMTLFFLLLLAPMMIAPCFGEGGRTMFLGFLKRGAFAVVSKFIYAMFLTIVLLVATAIASLNPNEVGWYAKWLLLLIFWWGILINRDQLLGFMDDGAGRNGMGLMRAYFGYRAVRDIGGDLAAGPRAALSGARRSGRVVRRMGSRRTEASQRLAGNKVRATAASQLGAERKVASQTALAADADRTRGAEVARELGDTDRRLQANEREQKRVADERQVAKAAMADGATSKNPRTRELTERVNQADRREQELKAEHATLTGNASSLRTEQAAIRGRLADPKVREAQAVAGRSAEVSQRDIDERIARVARGDVRTSDDQRLADGLRHADAGKQTRRERVAASFRGPPNTTVGERREARRQVRVEDRRHRARSRVR